MILDVKFSESNQSFNPTFGEVYNISNDGYEKGYAEGQEAGYSQGYEKGEEVGQQKGYADGYEKGESDGQEAGYSQGYETGNTEGYTKGYGEGYDKGVEDAAPTVEALTVTENGTYTTPNGVDGYSPVSVNVPIPDGYIVPSGTLDVTENGLYDATEFASVNVHTDGYTDLPTGYKRVDYIQFTDAQIVDTGIICNQDTQIQLCFTRELSSQHYLFGVASANNTASVTAYLGGSWRFGNKSLTKTCSTSDTLSYCAFINKSNINVTDNSATITGVSNFETIGSLLIGSCRSSNGNVGAAQYKGKIFYFIIRQGEEQVLKLVPVVSADGTYRFFDMVSKNFFDSITDVPLEGGNLY